MAWSLDVFDSFGVRSDGIFNCRAVRGTADTFSCHAEGRALDVGFPLVHDKPNPAGMALVQIIRPLAAQVGVQALIWNRTIWSNKSPGMEGRPYHGVDPHTGHVHIELSRTAAEKLNLKTIRHWLGADDIVDLSDYLKPIRKPAPPAKPKPYGGIHWEDFDHKAKPGARELHRGSCGEDVAFLQKFIGAKKCGRVDGRYGDKTVQAVRWYQGMRGIKVTGTVTEPTWKQLLAA